MFTVNVCWDVVPKLLDPVIEPCKVSPPTSLEPDIVLLSLRYPVEVTAKSEDGLTVHVVGDWFEVNLAVVPENPFELSYIAAPDIADSIT